MKNYLKENAVWILILCAALSVGGWYFGIRTEQDPNAGATVIFPTQGGTGISSYRKADLIVGTAPNTLGKLASGSEGQFLKMVSGAPAWATIAAGGGGGGSMQFREIPGSYDSTPASASFDGGKFTLTASGSTDVTINLDWGAGGPASLSQNETVTGEWLFNNDASVSGNFEVAGITKTDTLSTSTGTLTINAFTLGGAITGGGNNVTGLGHISGATASLSGNFQTSARIIGGTASHAFGGTIEGLTDNTLSFGTTAKKIKRIVVNTLLAIAKLIIPLNITPSEDGEIAYHQASDSFDVWNGTSATAMLLKCDVNKTLYYESPTKTKPTGLGFRITEPLTIFSIHSIASPSNVGVGWNLRDTAGNLVFSAQKSASSSFTYTSFTKSTFGKNTNLTLDIASKSAVSEFVRIDLCGYHNH